MNTHITTDFLVIGSGLAGLNFALLVADLGYHVCIVTKALPEDSSTAWAQGGLASVMDAQDSFDKHIKDTLIAGAGLCNQTVVEQCVKAGPSVVERLKQLGVRFDRNASNDNYALGQEGGHTQRRILHVADATGKEIEDAFLKHTRAHPCITLLTQHMGIDFITSHKNDLNKEQPNQCLGAYVFDKQNNLVKTIQSQYTLLASGGASKVYLYTSNPDIATGDGIAMAYRAHCEIANMEFMQFHPTCLYHEKAKSFLMTEALRGEGAILRNQNKDAFMARYHPQKDLAPRDIVTRAIDQEMKTSGADCVYLDITHQSRDFLMQRFPMLYERCLGFGIDMSQDLIPVVPAAHYTCGGVRTNLNAETSLNRLYAAGEVACTGLHGANRLASNSLLEAAVFSARAATHALTRIKQESPISHTVASWYDNNVGVSNEGVVVSQNWEDIRRLMWNYVGIVRSNKRLLRAQKRIELIEQEIQEYYWNFKITADFLELRNIACVAHLIIRSALKRKESRGLHYTLDYPQSLDSECHDTILTP